MANVTVSRDLVRKYPKEFGGRFGETVETKEVQDVMRAHGDAPTVGEAVAAKKKTALAAPAKVASRSPRKTAAKKATKK